MKDFCKNYRRKFLLGLATLPISHLGMTAVPATATPAAAEGPFYPSSAMRFEDTDNDLVKVTSRVRNAGGEIIRLQGQVVDQQGKAVVAARVEIWQCDLNARYLHSRDSAGQERDPNFQGFGHDISDDQGQYSFRTIKPVPYPGRTPHIHLKVWVDYRERLTTQLYLSQHPSNQRDWLFRRISAERREQVSMVFKPSGDEPIANIDLVV